MSQIRPVKFNVQGSRPSINDKNVSKKRETFTQPISFRGKPSAFESLSSDVKKLLEGCEPKPGRIRKFIQGSSIWLSERKGELQNQLINAFFTAFWAPIFIAFNPFTNEDTKTKKYTAWRQPVSAGVALLCSLPLTKVINNYLDKLASEGRIGMYDLRINPTDSFLTKLRKNTEASRKENNKKNFLKKERAVREDLFTKLLSMYPNDISINEKTGVIFCKSTGKEIGHSVSGLATNPELIKYTDSNNLYNLKFRDFMKKHFKFEFYDDGTLKPEALKHNMENVKAMDFLRTLGLFKEGEVTEPDVIRAILKIRQEAITESGIRSLFPSLRDDTIHKLANIYGQLAARVGQAQTGAKSFYEEALTLEQFLHPLRLEGNELQKLMNSTVAEVLDKFSRIYLKNLDIADCEVKTANGFMQTQYKRIFEGANGKTLEDFAKIIIKNEAKKVASHFSTFKAYAGIAVNLPIAILACTILNWAYPRIVECVAPELVKDDKKGGNK